MNTAASEGMLLTEQDLTCGRQLLLSVEVLVQLGRRSVFTSRIGKRAIQLHDRTHLEKRQIQRHDIIKGEARLLGTLVVAERSLTTTGLTTARQSLMYSTSE